MSTLSVVVITKNEEAKLTRCLDSIKPLADDVIIVDDVSTDNTTKIAQQFGAKVIINESNGNFAGQRNIGVENSCCEWILQMDADEVVPVETVDKIRAAINNPGNFSAFEIRRKNFFMGHPIKYSGNYGYALKIFKKGAGWYEGVIHESLKIDGSVGKIDADVEHYPFGSIYDVIARANFYSDLESLEFLKKVDSVSERKIRYELTVASIKRFWKLYVKKRGYKDGMHGFIWGILNVIGPQIRWIKIWEAARKQSKLVK